MGWGEMGCDGNFGRHWSLGELGYQVKQIKIGKWEDLSLRPLDKGSGFKLYILALLFTLNTFAWLALRGVTTKQKHLIVSLYAWNFPWLSILFASWVVFISRGFFYLTWKWCYSWLWRITYSAGRNEPPEDGKESQTILLLLKCIGVLNHGFFFFRKCVGT